MVNQFVHAIHQLHLCLNLVVCAIQSVMAIPTHHKDYASVTLRFYYSPLSIQSTNFYRLLHVIELLVRMEEQ